MNYFQVQVERLENLFQDARVNQSEIIRIYFAMIGHQDFEASNVIPFLNQKAVLLLLPEVVNVLKSNRLDAFSYLLVANNLLDLENVKEDLLNGDVLAKATPRNTVRILKAQLINLEAAVQELQIHERVYEENSSRLAVKLKTQCTLLKKQGRIHFFKLILQVVSTFADASPNIKRFSLGDSNSPMTRTGKTILLMGATGSGKTTWINAMINYVLGVEWEDDFRFVLVEEDVRGRTQAQSQTQGITAYDLRYRDGFRIPYSLTIIDTPGFGDTVGIVRDRKITSDIENLFRDKNGIEDLAAVGIVVQSAENRLTLTQKYIFNSVLDIFSRDIEENIHFLLTFSDGNLPPVLDTLKEALKKEELPCRKDSEGSPCYQKFNSAIYESPQSDEISHLHWKTTMENFKSFFEELSDMPTKSLRMTKEVLRLKKFLEMHRDSIQTGIDTQLMKMGELRKTEEIIAQNKDNIDENKDFKMKMTVMKKKEVAVDCKKALNCPKCKVTCHYPCNPNVWEESCPAFSTHIFHDILVKIKNAFENVPIAPFKPLISPLIGAEWAAAIATLPHFIEGTLPLINAASNSLHGNATCNVCPGKCPKDKHQHEDYKWESIQQEETQTLYDVREKYKAAKKQQSNAEEILNGLKEEIERLKADIFRKMEEITDCSNVLKKIALRGNPLTIMDHIEIIIDNEKRDEKPGYGERIKSLQDLKTAYLQKKNKHLLK